MADTPKDAARPMTAAETLTLHEIATLIHEVRGWVETPAGERRGTEVPISRLNAALMGLAALRGPGHPEPPGADLVAAVRQWAIYCFQHHGNDARLYNGLADLAGMNPDDRPSALPPALAAPPPDAIACPACGDTVRQVSSATLGLALFQHWNWACRRTPPAAPEP